LVSAAERTSSSLLGVAAVGNVYTHPAYAPGPLPRTTAAVVQALLQRQSLRTIVLNVARDNAAALRCYERLEFRPFCGYHEGVGRLGPASYSPQEQRVR
jgi:predicted GNAT family acetyltransferase